MAVYVDDMRARFGRMVMCHMVADSIDELHAMADRIGLSRRWFQTNSSWPHYDVSLSKRGLAVEAGAKEITWRECGMLINGWRKAAVAAKRDALQRASTGPGGE